MKKVLIIFLIFLGIGVYVKNNGTDFIKESLNFNNGNAFKQYFKVLEDVIDIVDVNKNDVTVAVVALNRYTRINTPKFISITKGLVSKIKSIGEAAFTREFKQKLHSFASKVGVKSRGLIKVRKEFNKSSSYTVATSNFVAKIFAAYPVFSRSLNKSGSLPLAIIESEQAGEIDKIDSTVMATIYPLLVVIF